jgi:hypothetical protein
MAIEIKIGKGEATLATAPPSTSVPITSVNLQIRRSVNGDYYISDHTDIDIIIMKDKSKVLVIAKDIMSSLVYGAQDRLFGFLTKKGLVAPDSVQGGSIYGSMEAQLLDSEELNVTNMAIINISKWIDEERPYFEFLEKYDEMEADRFTEPEEEDSTELGEVPHDPQKGTIRPGYTYGPYWQSYTYE